MRAVTASDFMRIKLVENRIQATRTESSINLGHSWICWLPNGDTVECKNIESARALAAKYNQELAL